MKKHLLLSILALFCISMVSAQSITIDEWTFEGATPQTSTNNKTIDKWDPTLAANSHTGSVLTYGENGTSSSAFYGASYLGLATMPGNITITLDIVDFSFAANGTWSFQFTGPGAGAEKMRGEFNIYNDNVSVHIEGNGTSLNGGSFIKQTDYSEFTSLQITYTWDFANNEMSYAVSGVGVPVDSAPASFSDSGSLAADLSGITDIRSLRVQTTPPAGSYLEMDNFKISYEPIPEPIPEDTNITIDEWTFEGATPQTSTNNKTINKWDPALANNSHAGSVLTYGESGSSSSAFYGASYLGLATMPANITITLDVVDFNFVGNGSYRFEFTGPGSGANNMRGEFNSFNGNISVHIEGNGTSFNGPGFINQSDYSEFTSLQITYTWDFANNEMSYAVSGTGVPVASEPASFSDSGNAAADLSGITDIRSFRVQTTPPAGSYLEMDNLKISYQPLVIWTGNGDTDTNWGTTGNWNTDVVPTATDVVIIPSALTNNPIIGSSTGAVTKDLIVDGSLTIESGGTLIVNGTSSGNVTYNRNLGTTNWYLMSSPVAGVTFNDTFVTANNIASGAESGNNRGVATYNTSSDDWTYLQGGGSISSVAGTGYSVKRATVGDVAFTGTINTSDVSVNVVTGGNGGFNLIGNPFTTNLITSSFLTDNTGNLDSQTLWVWNQATGVYDTYVTGDNFVLAPTQGFFIKAGADASLNIKESYQTTTSGTFQKSAKTELKLFMSDVNSERVSRINYLLNSTTGFDNGFDGETFGGIANNFDIFTNLVTGNQGKKYQVQSLPKSDMESIVVPVGITAEAGKEITFTAEALNLPVGLKVFLEDRENNTVTRLDEANANYKVTLNSALNGAGRFYLHTRSSALSTNDIALDGVSVYALNRNTLRINGINSVDANIKIYNILGKKVVANSFSSKGTTDINIPNLNTGIYIVELETEKGKLNKKIILE